MYYPKKITKMEICLERILTFCTLNEHILLIKCVSDDGTIFKENGIMSVCERPGR